MATSYTFADRARVSLANPNNTIILLAPLLAVIEVIVNVIALILPITFIRSNPSNIGLFSLYIVLAYYLYVLSFLFITGSILHFIPKLPEGPLPHTARSVWCLLYQAIYQMIIRNKLSAVIRETTPIPGSLFYRLAGAKLHPSALFSEGAYMSDPYLVEIGSGTVIGSGSMLISHFRPTVQTTILRKITIGNNVMVGAKALIYAGATIGDNAQIQALSLVKPNTVIPANEIWGGRPAVKIGNVEDRS